MDWLVYVSYFFGGVFAANGVPHFVSGVMGRALQTPFSRPRGVGQSSSKVNTLWGFANFVVAYILVVCVGSFSWQAIAHVLPFGIGFVIKALGSAHQMGRFHGGNDPTVAPKTTDQDSGEHFPKST